MLLGATKLSRLRSVLKQLATTRKSGVWVCSNCNKCSKFVAFWVLSFGAFVYSVKICPCLPTFHVIADRPPFAVSVTSLPACCIDDTACLEEQEEEEEEEEDEAELIFDTRCIPKVSNQVTQDDNR